MSATTFSIEYTEKNAFSSPHILIQKNAALFDIFYKTYNTSLSTQQFTTDYLTQLMLPQQQQARSQPFLLAFLTTMIINKKSLPIIQRPQLKH